MSKKGGNYIANSGCVTLLFAISVIATILIESLPYLLVIAIAVAAFWAIASGAKVLMDRRQENAAEKQSHLNTIDAAEPKPKLLPIAADMDFSCEEEKQVNLDFRAFVQFKNDETALQTRIEYLSKKIDSLHALGRTAELAQAENERARCRMQLAQLKPPPKRIYDSACLREFCKEPGILEAYTALAAKLPNRRMELLGDYFQNPKVKVVALSNKTSALIFTPCYVLYSAATGSTLRLIPYTDVTVQSRIITKRQEGELKSGQEYERKSYRHINNDGTRDMRYSYSNNPVCYDVYCGEVIFTLPQATYTVSFDNKTSTLEYEKSAAAYLNLLRTNCSDALEAALKPLQAALPEEEKPPEERAVCGN
jgi:hypothetical protein